MKFSKLIKKSYRAVLMHDAYGQAWLSNGYWVVPLLERVAGLSYGRALHINMAGKPNLLDGVAMLYWAGGQLSITYKSGSGAVVDCNEDAALDYLSNSYAFNDDCKASFDVMLVAEIAKFYKQETFSSNNAQLGGLSKHSSGVVMLQKCGLVFYVQTLLESEVSK
jgi:hypothetical protein